MSKCDVCGSEYSEDACVCSHGLCRSCREFGRWHDDAVAVWDDEEGEEPEPLWTPLSPLSSK